MPLPTKPFYSIVEAAARWGCSVRDVAAYAAADHFRIVAGLRPVKCGGDTIAGLVEVAIHEAIAQIEHAGAGAMPVHIYRLRPFTKSRDDRAGDWRIITEPCDGVAVRIEGLSIPGSDASVFEAEHEIFGKPRTTSQGAPRGYDWDDFWRHLAARIYREGLPETQEELVAEMQEFFIRRSDTGEAPESSTLRKRIRPLWQELRAH
jgi:hypothetical protein